MIIGQKELEEILAGKTGRFVAAIDGRCGSGKTTLADKLAKRFGAGLIHMDDFYLRPEQRTEQRLKEAGGNIDYERFEREVIRGLEEGSFSYRPYQAHEGRYLDPVCVKTDGLVIVEGSYSTHPVFKKYYDLSVFMDIDPDKQIERIKSRCPKKLDDFIRLWIPKEEAYFEAFSIEDQADYIIKN